MGVARDFGGNDERLGATTKMYNGSARRERRFQRFSNGFGCHYTIGFLIDDEGDDSYNGTIMGTGFAWDCSVGYLMDFGGNDSYLATGGGTQGQGKQAGLGVLYDYDGDDVYKGYGQGLGRAESTIILSRTVAAISASSSTMAEKINTAVARRTTVTTGAGRVEAS